MILLGGRIAEEIMFKDISSGASHDLQQVKKIAEQMIVHLGMGDQIIISDPQRIHEEVDHIISIAYSRTKIMLSNVESLIKDCAHLLVLQHEVTPDAIMNLIRKYPYIKLP
jgi:cell division protease FtsH